MNTPTFVFSLLLATAATIAAVAFFVAVTLRTVSPLLQSAAGVCTPALPGILFVALVTLLIAAYLES